MKLLLIGPPASGKGTIGEKLSEEFGIPLLSVGELLRELPEDYPLKKEIDEAMERGELAPQKIAAQVLKEAVEKESCHNGFVIDGWGRDLSDLTYYDPEFDNVIYLIISADTAEKRISSRRTCEKCGAVYNLISVPPKVSGVCDFCGGKLVQRDDETSEATRKRFEIFNTETKETIDYFKNERKLLEIDAEGSIDEVYERVRKALGY